jgi:hypothetical protein
MNNKRKLFGVIMSLSLVLIIGVALVVPIFVAGAKKNKNSYTTYAYGGQVTVQLPDGMPPHPTTLLIAAQHIQKRGDYPMRGPHNLFMVSIWVPMMNRFLPAAAIGTNPNTEHQQLIKEAYNGTFLWNPQNGMENLFWVDKEKLVTWRHNHVFFANLTEGVHVSLNFTGTQMNALGDLSFDLPPIAFEVRGLDGHYRGEGDSTMPSGYMFSAKYVRKPAWVRLWIQEWTPGGPGFKFAGELGTYVKTTMTAPPTT